MTDRPSGLDRLLGYVATHLNDGEDKPKEMTREEIEQTRTQLTSSLLAFSEVMTPVFDHADGIRADLKRRGWSDQAAEQVALLWLLSSVQGIAGGWGRQ